MPTTKNTLAYHAKHGRNISRDENKPKWLNTRIGCALTTGNKDGALKVIVNYLPPANADGSYSFMLYPPSDDDAKK